MYGHNYSPFPRASADFSGQSGAVAGMTFTFPPPQIIVPDQLAGAEFAALSSEQMCCNSSSSASGCSSYGSPSYCTQPPPSLMQRSVSSHSLPKNSFHHLISTTSREFADSESGGPVRRVFSTGDLQKINGVQSYQRSESPLSNENTMIYESMNRASKYTPEEKKERIDRYKTKRTQRNFNKIIKYACRKTLADSRPRIRGRFARHDEIEKNPENQWSHIGEDEDDYNWINLVDAFSANLP